MNSQVRNLREPLITRTTSQNKNYRKRKNKKQKPKISQKVH